MNNNEFLKKIKEWKDTGILMLVFVISMSIYFIITLCIQFSKTEIDLEQKVMNNFCNYAVEKGLISVEEYVMKYEDEDERIYFDDIYSDEDLCVDIYIKYLKEIINE